MTLLRGLLVFCSLASFIACSEDKEGTDKEDTKLAKQASAPSSSFYFPQVVYGDDNRLDIYQVTDPAILSLADSTVALVRSSDVTTAADGSLQLTTKSYATQYGLCTSEPFYNQQLGAFCSGFLVAPDTIVTAGHCITAQSACQGVKFVFGFNVKQAGVITTKFSSNDVYSCKTLVHSQAESADYAVVKLDRPVVGHLPLRLRQQSAPVVGDPLVVIGHPAGLPTKVAGGANIRSIQSGYLVANLDTYGGNSGSAVFNAQTGQVEGILVRGEMDYVTQGTCRVSNHCESSACRGEDVTLISQVLPHLSTGPTLPIPTSEEFSFVGTMPIPDNNSAGLEFSVDATSAPAGRSVQVKVDIDHSWRGDLAIHLVAPDGQVIRLHQRTGGSADHVKGVFGGDLVALDDLNRLKTVETVGQWKLRVYDLARWDVGRLNSWSLNFVE